MKIRNLTIFIMPFIALLLIYPVLAFFRKYPVPCPVRFLTGIYCIGCGGTRCITALLHGKFLLAVRQNFIVFSGVIFMSLIWIQNIFSLSGRKIKLIPENRTFYIAVSGIFLIYAVVRNFIPEIAPV